MAFCIPNTSARYRGGKLQRGFNYPLLLAAMVIVGVVLAGLGEVWHIAALREKEAQLLFVGNEFSQAIGRYYEFTPSGPKQYPQSLNDLLLDQRFPRPVRHLRKLYVDPFRGVPEWGLILEQGRIIGVYSEAEGVPMRKLGVPSVGSPGMVIGGNSAASEALSYSSWRFVYRPANTMASGAMPPTTLPGMMVNEVAEMMPVVRR
ncbi:type II secretion system protein [Dechloromonas denitrificans]|uniref:type II secretion system protein n=1 Tax=Dechloromonas denitrificans TaxID=281362 RepID=UPI001CF8292A|nr:type II secretion system protein [Dechloromonas denitrificans]UCV03325.1 type II secretion system protein [Dechloromonas denitrificans]